jgi:hypothetical protein
VRSRTRIFSHGNSDSFATAPQILQVIGAGPDKTS